MKNNNLSVKVASLLILFTLIILQVWHIRKHTGIADEQVLGGRTGLPASGLPENPVAPKGALHVEQAINDAKRLYADIQTYRRFHNSQMPKKEIDFEVDRRNNYKQYGYTSFSQVNIPFGVNPDMQFSDVASFRNQWQRVNPFVICLKRPDGSDVGGPKQPGARDVVAYSRMYFHLNSRHYNGFKDTINPDGFFLVVWDDGTIQQLTYKDEMFIKQDNKQTYTTGFKGQAGVPADAIPFVDFYKQMPRH